MTTSYAGTLPLSTASPDQDSDTILSGGTAGCVLAGRLAENPDLSILLVEAGPPNETVSASAMPAGLVFP